MYRWFEAPVDLAHAVEELLPHVGEYRSAYGASHFGDLFLRSGLTGEFAVLVVEAMGLTAVGFSDVGEFRLQFLENAGVVRSILRPADVEALSLSLGPLEGEQVFFPVPMLALGGSNALDTYSRGDLWVHLSLVAQTFTFAGFGAET